MEKAFHGGDSFHAIGDDFSHLERRHTVINADVLDAWYDPAPSVLEAISSNLAWLIKTSPPTHGEGLVRVLEETRGIAPDHLILGSGTSGLMYVVLPSLEPKKVAMLHPTYSEYPHLASVVMGAEVLPIPLDPENGFAPDDAAAKAAIEQCDLLILVNPNSPNGGLISQIRQYLEWLPKHAVAWLDETYIDFSEQPSLEALVANDPRLIVAKSMSKFYGLSGLRIGYLATSHPRRAEWDALTPPWSVGLIAQVAAVHALRAKDYYDETTRKTRELRNDLAQGLQNLGLTTAPSETNFILFRTERPAHEVVDAMRERDIWLRDCASLSDQLPPNYVRTSVKEAPQNERILAALKEVL